MIYSPNMLKTFESCPQKFYLKYVEQVSMPQKASYFEKGKKIHALANYYLRGDNIEKLEKTLSLEESSIWQTLKNNEYFKKTYVNSEYNLSCKIGGYWIGGRIDALVKDEANLYILDYKTGSIPQNPESDFQTMVYLLCLTSLMSANEVTNTTSLNFIYIDLKNNHNHLIKLTDEKTKGYEQAIIQICDKITNFTPEIEHKKICDFCEYRKICI